MKCMNVSITILVYGVTTHTVFCHQYKLLYAIYEQNHIFFSAFSFSNLRSILPDGDLGI